MLINSMHKLKKIIAIILLSILFILVFLYFFFNLYATNYLKSYLNSLGYSQVEINEFKFDLKNGLHANLIKVGKNQAKDFELTLKNFKLFYHNSKIKIAISELDLSYDQKQLASTKLSDTSTNFNLIELTNYFDLEIKKFNIDLNIPTLKSDLHGRAELSDSMIKLFLAKETLFNIEKLNLSGVEYTAKILPQNDFEVIFELENKKLSLNKVSFLTLDPKIYLNSAKLQIDAKTAQLHDFSAAIEFSQQNVSIEQLVLNIDSDSLNLNSINLAGVSLQTQLANMPTWHTLSPSQFSIDKILKPLEISKIKSKFEITSGDTGTLFSKLILTKFNADIFAGKISKQDKISAIIFDLQSSENKIPLKFSKIDLSEILKVYPQKDLVGTGILSGSLDLLIKNAEVSASGRAAAINGGFIKYTPEAESIPINPALNLVYKALQNYHYSSLTSDIAYQTNGKLLLSLQMQGVNPDLNKSQSINVNINLEENLIQLFKALNLNQHIEDSYTNNK